MFQLVSQSVFLGPQMSELPRERIKMQMPGLNLTRQIVAQEFVFVIHFLKWKTFGPADQSISLIFPVLSQMASLKCEVYLDPTWRGDRYPSKPCHGIPGCVISQDLALFSPPPFPGACQSL